MKDFGIGAIIFALFLTSGCASQGSGRNASLQVQNQKLLEENEKRLETLEKSLNSLTSQIAQLNNRVYEVRNKNGQKTSMTVVPISPAPVQVSQPAVQTKSPEPAMRPGQTAENALQASKKASTSETPPPTPQAATTASASAATQPVKANGPVGRKIDPASAPSPLRASQQAQPGTKVAGASGRVGQTARTNSLPPSTDHADLALPPTDLPAPVIAADSPTPQNTTTGSNVPVPNIYASELALPPETEVSDIVVPRAQSSPSPQAARTQSNSRGEEAAYNAALKAARSGHLNEAINLFRQFEQQYPNGRYKANANYWIGECLYSQGKLQDALAQFQNVNTAYPTHHKNADALLKAGMTLSRLGDQAGAQEKYRTLINSFPNSDAAKRARAMGVK